MANEHHPGPTRRGVLTLATGLAATAALNKSFGALATTATSSWVPVATDAVKPFRVAVPQASIDDLKRRLSTTRWPERETVNDWSQGVPLSRAQALIAQWTNHYDWRAFETKINAFPQFRTRIDGLGVHFIHVKSRHQNALPILLTHGWPGSIVEFLNTIRPLTDPTAYGGKAEDAFHVVIPSLPGHGFSDRPTEKGWNRLRTAKAWGTLMKRLGYDRWVAQGGDWGSAVTLTLAQQRPAGLIAAHVNWPLVTPPTPPANPTPQEAEVFAELKYFGEEGSGYFKEQSTRPQTIGYALADSPVGQATWLYEKFHDWSDHPGDADALPTVEMLDDISLYWFTDTAASAARFYWENAHSEPPFSFNAGPVDLPMAATIYAKESFRAPKAWAEKLWPNLFYWNEIDRGGHFAAWEQPTLFVEDLRKAFATQRKA
jgi:pimeloyl-ACP methyl ester carboxylesterase